METMVEGAVEVVSVVVTTVLIAVFWEAWLGSTLELDKLELELMGEGVLEGGGLYVATGVEMLDC